MSAQSDPADAPTPADSSTQADTPTPADTAQPAESAPGPRAGLNPTDDEDLALAVQTPRIHNPGLFEKSLKAAVAATAQYGNTDRAPRDQSRGDGTAEPPAQVESAIERVQRIGYQLAMVSGFDKYPFTFGVVDLAVPNAFALPAGQIFVTQGMLNLGLTDDQLAALLGHELAHVTEEHFLKIRRKATLLNSLATLVSVGAAVASSSSNDDYYVGPGGYVVNDNSTADLLQASMATGAVVSELLLRSYSRDNEDQSDDEGQRLAALAGFDPDGARQLMAKMNIRIPQDKSFGYWQTHPFFDERVVAAEARAKSLVAQEAPDPDHVAEYRRATQTVLLDYIESKGVTPHANPGENSDFPSTRGPVTAAPKAKGRLDAASADLLKTAALRAWPSGARADAIRVERLHRLRDRENRKLGQSRNYGSLIGAYMDTVEEIAHFDSQSAALSPLTQELGVLRQEKLDLLPVALRVLDGGIYQTEFLESYLSNYPDSDRAAEAGLQLGLAYSRLQREAEAVERFLAVWLKDPDSTQGQTAARGIRNLAPLLTQLTALEKLALQDRDPSIADLAIKQLDRQAHSFEEMPNGSSYLKTLPEGLYAETVAARLEELAEHLYREMRLYEEVGDSAKAISRANQILQHAPLSKAAQRLSRELAEEEIEEAGVGR